MLRAIAAALLLLPALPATAQEVTGSCTDGSLWWGGAQAAGLGPCESPEEGFFRIACTAGTPTLTVLSPYPVADGQRGTVDLTVDGTLWRLEGAGTFFERTGDIGLSGAPLPAAARAALAAGRDARLDMPTETRPFHLTGSGAALAALTC